MPKKIQRKSKNHIPSKKKKTAGYYLQLYFISMSVAVIVLVVGSFFTKAPSPCANSATCNSDRSVQINNNELGTFEGRTVVPPKMSLAMGNVSTSVLGASTNPGDKHIYVDLSTQRLYAYQGSSLVMNTFISSGKWDPTPVGNFHIWEKLVSTRMAGGSGADAYDLPNVPYVMYFYQDYGLHGAYWHNNFGHMMSHGCVNERLVDAKALYEWADGPSGDQPGTAVSVCNSFSPPNNCVQQNPITD
jgi:L,D-transpeptidase-like protein